MAERHDKTPITIILGSCHGSWREQGLVCSLSDLLFNAQYIVQLFDWQNAVFLCFYPLMLFVAATIFRTTFKGFGAKDLDGTIRNAGGLLHGKPMPTSEGIELTNFEHYKVEAPRKNIAVMISMAGFIWSIGLISWASTSQFVNPSAPDAMYYQGRGALLLIPNLSLCDVIAIEEVLNSSIWCKDESILQGMRRRRLRRGRLCASRIFNGRSSGSSLALSSCLLRRS